MVKVSRSADVPLSSKVGPVCHRATAKGGRRRKWFQEVNRIAMEYYYSSNPEVVGYRDRIHMILKQK